jgi:hypothetical protein
MALQKTETGFSQTGLLRANLSPNTQVCAKPQCKKIHKINKISVLSCPDKGLAPAGGGYF